MLGVIIRTLLGPLISLGEKYIEEQTKREALRNSAAAITERVRQFKLGYALLRIPLFVAEMSAALYFAAVMIDSTFPSDYLNPLELPKEFKDYFLIALSSMFGLTTIERILRR